MGPRNFPHNVSQQIDKSETCVKGYECAEAGPSYDIQPYRAELGPNDKLPLSAKMRNVAPGQRPPKAANTYVRLSKKGCILSVVRVGGAHWCLMKRVNVIPLLASNILLAENRTPAEKISLHITPGL